MKTALLLIDFQNDYFEGGKIELVNPLKAVENASILLRDFREKDLKIIHIQHHSVRPDATFFIPGTQGAKIHSKVQPIKNELVITKNFPNSFRETDLLQNLKEKDIKKLVISGMMTHMCVDATVRAYSTLGGTSL